VSDPTVCCLLLTADRQRFTDRAVRCFIDQTCDTAHLLIYDTGEVPYYPDTAHRAKGRMTLVYNPSSRGRKIGALRNEAIGMINSDIIIHWDSDDWSSPERVAYQLGSLSGYEIFVHGFHNLLFLDTRHEHRAWEYDYKKFLGNRGRVHAVGSSLAYWRDTWKRTPFSELTTYEDPDWCNRVPVSAENGVGTYGVAPPLLIAEVHGGNMSNSYSVFDRHQQWVNPEWRRAPEWDQYCSERLYP
jgi:glycosyltransferase involved in cell wall biosynthesis